MWNASFCVGGLTTTTTSATSMYIKSISKYYGFKTFEIERRKPLFQATVIQKQLIKIIAIVFFAFSVCGHSVRFEFYSSLFNARLESLLVINTFWFLCFGFVFSKRKNTRILTKKRVSTNEVRKTFVIFSS